MTQLRSFSTLPPRRRFGDRSSLAQRSPPIRSRSAFPSASPAPTASSRRRSSSRPSLRSTRSTPRAACSAVRWRSKSPMTRPAPPARRRPSTTLIFQKKVDVLISMETSAARNAALPIVARGKTPYIYTSFYEGKSCSPYMYVNAWVPEQQVPPIVDYFAKDKGAKTFFLIGSDYAFGRGMLAFTKAYIEKTGGKVVGEEYLPMDGSDWTPIISKLKSAAPDALITSTAGGAPNVTLTKQLRAAGVKLPYGNLAVDEGTAKSMGTDAEGIYLSASYVTGIDTAANKTFLASMEKKFGARSEDAERSLGAGIRSGLRL